MLTLKSEPEKDWNKRAEQIAETAEFGQAMKDGNKVLYASDGKEEAVIIIQRYIPVLKLITARAQIFTSSKNKEFLNAILNKLKKMKIPYARIGNTMFGFDNHFKIKNSKIIERHTFILDLKKTENELWENMDKKTRNAIRKAEKENVELKEIENKSELMEYIQLSKKTGERIREEKGRKTFSGYSEHFLKSVYKNKNAKFVIALHENKIIAGALFLTFKDKVLYFDGCSSPEHRTLQAPSAVQWYFIRKARQKGLKVYDMGGCTPNLDEKDSRYFIYEFKRKWGGELKKFYNLECSLSWRKKLQDILIKLLY